MTARILTLGSDEYHADMVDDRPSLSSSIAKILVDQSPAHAREAHPKLNPNFVRAEKSSWDLGTCAHQLFLEGGADRADVLEFDNYRTKAAKEARDESRAAGRVPILAHEWAEVERMVKAMADQLVAIDAKPDLFVDGRAEQTLVWEEDGVLCRARLDWLHDDLSAIDDLKTTAASANPEKWTRTMYGIGADVQVAFYLRGLAKVAREGLMLAGPVAPHRAEFRYVVVETRPPYALSVVELSAEALALADEKVDQAIAIWKRCLDTGKWPAYSTGVYRVDAPAWEIAKWDGREEVAA